MVQLSHRYMTTEKNTALKRQTFVGKVTSLLFHMLSRFVMVAHMVGKEFTCSAVDLGSIPGPGRSAEGNDNPLQYSCLENSVDRGAWWATVHGVAKSWT